MIVQCPSCETRFSVDPELISGVKNPRYHCSRCDHLFEVNKALALKEQEKTSPHFDPKENEETLFSETLSREQLDLLPLDESPLITEPIAPVSFEDFSSEEEESLPLLTAQWPEGNISKPYEADLRTSLPPDLQKRFDRKPKYNNGTDLHISSPPTSPLSSSHSEMTLEPRSEPKIPAPLSTTSETPSLPRIDDLSFDLVDPGPSEVKFRPYYPKQLGIQSFLSPVLLVCSCPIIIALLFFVWSQFLSSDPHNINKLLSMIRYQPAQLAPAGLNLVNLQSDLVTLFDGKQVLEIEGILKNASSKVLRDIQIEARLFDKQNRPIEKKLVHYDSSLGTASTIDSMKKESLETLEKKLPSKQSSFAPQALQNIRIIFTGDIENARWFTTRVYTVKEGVRKSV